MRLSWDEMFEKAKEYYIEHGDLTPPQTYIASDGTKLGAWVNTQRAVRNGIRPGIMDEERIRKLDSIGIDWNPNQTAWNNGYNELEKYYSEYGDSDVPLRYVTNTGYKLGLWLQNQRRSYWNKGRGKLNEEQISRLDSLDISWDPYLDQWMRNYEKLKQYHHKYGNVDIPKDYTINSVNLFRWLDTQRQTLNDKGKGKLNRKQRRLLGEIGVDSRNKLDLRWEEMFGLAKAYYQKYGHLSMIQSYSTEGGVNLGNWIFTQRSNWRNGILDKDREMQLRSIGMVWEYTSKKQTSFFEQTIFYYISKVFNDAVSRDKSIGVELDIYIPSQKIAVEYDGQVFHSGKKIENDEHKNALCNQFGISLYRIRERDCPKMKDERNNIYLRENTIDAFEDSLLLLFTKLHVNTIPLIDVNKDCGDIFSQFLMVGPPIDDSDNSNYIITTEWMEYFQLAKEYYEDFGDLLIKKDNLYKGKNLGIWISNQRHYYNSKAVPYPEQKICLLESIGMVWDIPDYRWETGYHYAKLFYKENGHLDVPSDYTVDGYELGHWILNQRSKKTERHSKVGKLTVNQIMRLEEIGMIWNSLDYRWEEMFDLAKAYYNEYGNLRIPYSFVVSDRNLGKWIAQQRKNYKTGTNSHFTRDRVSRLEAIGMEWEIGKGNVRSNILDKNWEEMFEIVQDYIITHPDVRITKRLISDDNVQIGSWIYRQKRIYQGKEQGVQKKWMIEKLKSIGLI